MGRARGAYGPLGGGARVPAGEGGPVLGPAANFSRARPAGRPRPAAAPPGVPEPLQARGLRDPARGRLFRLPPRQGGGSWGPLRPPALPSLEEPPTYGAGVSGGGSQQLPLHPRPGAAEPLSGLGRDPGAAGTSPRGSRPSAPAPRAALGSESVRGINKNKPPPPQAWLWGSRGFCSRCPRVPRGCRVWGAGKRCTLLPPSILPRVLRALVPRAPLEASGQKVGKVALKTLTRCTDDTLKKAFQRK